EGGEARMLPIGPEHKRSVTATQTHRGLRVAAWVGNTTLDLLDEAGRVLCHVEMPEASVPGPVAVSPNGTRLACPLVDGRWGRLAVVDATTGKRTAGCDGPRDGAWAFPFSPGGKRAAAGGGESMAPPGG